MRKSLFLVATMVALGVSLCAQVPAQTPRALAPIDLTGNWVSIVTEDWRFRMVTPSKGDYASVPLNAAARAVADKWDPTKDEAEGNACKSYGAASQAGKDTPRLNGNLLAAVTLLQLLVVAAEAAPDAAAHPQRLRAAAHSR